MDFALPNGFEFTGDKFYPNYSEVKTPYKNIYLFLKFEENNFYVSDFYHLKDLNCNYMKIVNKLNEEKIGYSIWIQDNEILDRPIIEHKTCVEKVNDDLVKIAKLLSDLSNV